MILQEINGTQYLHLFPELQSKMLLFTIQNNEKVTVNNIDLNN